MLLRPLEKTLTLLACLLLACLLLVAPALAGDKVKVAYLPITHALPVLAQHVLAEKSGGVEVELVRYGSWPELMDALNTGNVDAASVLVEIAMKAREQGVDLAAGALGHKDGNVIVVAPSVNDMRDLKGKTFAIPHRQSSHNVLLGLALQKAGMTYDDIRITELAPTEMPSALAAGTISGYCVAEPFGAKAVTLGIGKVLYESGELWPDSVCCALVFYGPFLKDKPELAKRFLAEYAAAADALSSDPALVETVAKKYLKLDPKTLELSMKYINFKELKLTKAAYDTLCDRLRTFGISQMPPAFKDFVKD